MGRPKDHRLTVAAQLEEPAPDARNVQNNAVFVQDVTSTL
jgi:hypothetical protein